VENITELLNLLNSSGELADIETETSFVGTVTTAGDNLPGYEEAVAQLREQLSE